MTSPSLERLIIDQLHKLDDGQQKEVLRYARSLTELQTTGRPGKDLLRFAGTIDKDELRIMATAIQADCEHIEADAW